jgi:hypothetical protein
MCIAISPSRTFREDASIRALGTPLRGYSIPTQHEREENVTEQHFLRSS